MGLFGSTTIKILKNVPDGVIIAVTGAKSALKCELVDLKEDEHNMIYPKVMTLNGVPLINMHPSYCPTCCGMLATGYGLDNIKCTELTDISYSINSGFNGIEKFIDTIRPLIGLLEDGIYLIRDTETYPVDGDGRFFWAVPDELKFYNAFTDAYYISEIMNLVDLKGSFLYPTQSRERYDENRVRYYMDIFRSEKAHPRAVAYNVMGGMSALLDGHHKACAAARLHIPVNTVVITKGHLTGPQDAPKIGFWFESEPEYEIPFDKNISIPQKLYKQYADQLADAFVRKKRPTPELYKGLPIKSKFTEREWEKHYIESAYFFPYAYQLAAELNFDFNKTEKMSAEEIYYYIFQQDDPVYYGQTVIGKLLRSNDKRTKVLLTKLAHLPFTGEKKQIIASALRGIMRFKDEETEKIFIDFAVCDDDYLADIAKDYWEDGPSE